MLTHRPDLAKCARACFERQTYRDKILVELDTRGRTESIGHLRNEVNALALARGADAIIHWDDDDWSCPERIDCQVTLAKLLPSKDFVTGFTATLFWDERKNGEAWIYSTTDPYGLLGTSLMYPAKMAEGFADTSVGEDFDFLRRHYCTGFDGLVGIGDGLAPLLIARIHDRNTSPAYDRALMHTATEWTRAPKYDDICREAFRR